jgi:hypothetical protein
VDFCHPLSAVVFFDCPLDSIWHLDNVKISVTPTTLCVPKLFEYLNEDGVISAQASGVKLIATVFWDACIGAVQILCHL